MARKTKVNISDVRLMFENGLSTYQIADKLQCNQAHVYRMIQKWNKANPNDQIKLRSKSEAQKIYMDKNGHQRVGTSHSEQSKESISDKMQNFYDSPEGEEAKKRIAEVRREEWSKKSDKDKNNTINDMRVASREQMKNGVGSKFENFMAEELTLSGFSVEQRSRRFIGNLEVDIALVNDSIAIEVDGPTHWADVYGANKLQEVQAKDKIKNDLLTSSGWDVLRVQDKSGSCTRARVKRVIAQIEQIKKERARTNVAKVYIIRT